MWGILVLKHTQNPYSAEHPELLHTAENTAEQVQSNLHSRYFSFSVCSNMFPEKKLIFCKTVYQQKQRNSHFKEIFLFFKRNLPHLSTAWLETPEARVGSWGLLVLPQSHQAPKSSTSVQKGITTEKYLVVTQPLKSNYSHVCFEKYYRFALLLLPMNPHLMRKIIIYQHSWGDKRDDLVLKMNQKNVKYLKWRYFARN